MREMCLRFFGESIRKKIGKDAARRAFAKIPKSAIKDLVPAIAKQKKSEQWRKDGGQYIPNPATWLNQGRWQDEITNGKSYTTAENYEPSAPKEGEFERLKKLLASVEGQ